MSDFIASVIFADLAKALLLVCLILLAGQTLLTFARVQVRNRHLLSLLELFYGLTFVVSAFSVYSAQLRTVNVILIAFLAWVLGRFPRLQGNRAGTFVWDWRRYFENILLLYLPFLLYVGLQLFRYQFLSGTVLRLGFMDFSFYSDVAESYLTTGLEKAPNWYNNFSCELFGYSSNPEPYHPFDLWLHALTLAVTSLKGNYAFVIISIPLMGSIATFAVYSVIRSYAVGPLLFRSCWMAMVCAIFASFLVGWIPGMKVGFDQTAFVCPKVFVSYLGFAILLLLCQERLHVVGLLHLLALALFNIVLLPVVVTTSAVYWAVGRWLGWPMRGRLVIGAGLLLLAVTVFYGILFTPEWAAFSLNDKGFGDRFVSATALFLRGYLVKLPLFYWPASLGVGCLALIACRSKEKLFDAKTVLVCISIVLAGTGLTSYSVHINAFQFISLLANPLLALCSVVVLCLVFSTRCSGRWLVGGAMLAQAVVGFYSYAFGAIGDYYAGPAYSTEFVAELRSTFRVANKVGGFVRSASNNHSLFTLNPGISKFSSVLDSVENGHVQVSLSIPLDKAMSDEMRRSPIVTSSPLFKYREALEAKGRKMGDDELRFRFAEAFKLGYVIVEPGASLPMELRRVADLGIVDSVSGLAIYSLHF